MRVTIKVCDGHQTFLWVNGALVSLTDLVDTVREVIMQSSAPVETNLEKLPWELVSAASR